MGLEAFARALGGAANAAISLEGGVVASALGAFFSPFVRGFYREGNMDAQNQFPSVGQLMNCLLTGRGDPDRMSEGLIAYGVPLGSRAHAGDLPDWYFDLNQHLWRNVMDSMKAVPAPGELMALINRDRISPALANDALRHLGFADDFWRDHLTSLRHQIPPPSDLVSFALKEVWDPDVVDRYQYDDEFPAEFETWMQRQGYTFDPRVAADRRLVPRGFTWPKAYWRAHWQTISAGQAYEMFQRLRPGRVGRFRATFPGLRAFTLADLRSILKIHDYPVPFRDQLAALSYHKPRLLDVDRWYKASIVDRNEARELLLDYGYDPTLADTRLRWLDQTIAGVTFKRGPAKMFAKTRQAILDSYRIGSLARPDAEFRLHNIDTAEAADRAGVFPAPPLAGLDLARSNARATWELNLIDYGEQLEGAKILWDSIRKAFLGGMVNDVDAKAQLLAAGFDAMRVDRWIIRWRLQRNARIVTIAASKIQRLYARGIITPLSADNWLLNLGYQPAARALLLAEAQQDLQLAFARAQEKAAKTKAGQQKAMEAQLRAQKTALKETQAAFVKSGSPPQLARWFVRGIIDENLMRSGLTKQGVPLDGINRWVADAKIDRAAALQKAMDKAKAAKTGATNGTTNGTVAGPA